VANIVPSKKLLLEQKPEWSEGARDGHSTERTSARTQRLEQQRGAHRAGWAKKASSDKV
jgi:hypothetical protein